MAFRDCVVPDFAEPGTYVRFRDLNQVGLVRFRRLLERWAPLRFPYRWSSVAAGSAGTIISFDDLNPSKDKEHLYQLFLGISPKVAMRIYHPMRNRILEWDEAIDLSGVDEDETAIVTSMMSPLWTPQFDLWVENDHWPRLEPYNYGGAAVAVEVLFIGAMFRFEEVADHELIDKLLKNKIPSLPVSFAGGIE